ncbi:MAG: hypothetical protein WBB32_04895 [Flavobacteriales bacterium]
MRKPIRLQLFLTVAALAAFTIAHAQNVGINTNGIAADPAAILDLNVDILGGNAKRGLLIPRMTEAQRLAIPVGAADDALLVYQTDLGASPDLSNGRGFWYYDGPDAQWKHLSVARQGWLLQGNTLTGGAPPEYLGTAATTLNNNLLFRTELVPANPAMQMGYNLYD